MSLKCDSLDCKRRGSDNETGDIPFIAPMKIKFLNSLILENKQRCGVALLLFVCLGLFALTPGAAQLRNQRRITALQLGEAAEGSRVTVVSDSPLNDYEAFRRGDRFYVKIPLADFTSALPHFRANGFEDVQVQKAGDGLIVSFKLQPGASARVDQRGNRLDVIFSAPNRSPFNNAASAGSGRESSRNAAPVGNPQTAVDRGRAAAGPMPPGSVSTSRDRVVTGRAGDGNEGRAARNPLVLTNPQSNSNKSSRKGAKTGSTRSEVAVTSPAPVSSPASVLSSGPSSNYSPLPTATPANSATSRPVASSVNWKQRGIAARRWVSTNRLTTLLGALILLSLILYLAMAFRSRRKNVSTTKRAKTPKVQPKYSPAELNELSSTSFNEQTTPALKNEAATAQAGSAGLSDREPRPSAVQEQPQGHTQPPATVPAPAAAKARSEWVLTKPTITSPTAGHHEYSSEEEEREVFEL